MIVPNVMTSWLELLCPNNFSVDLTNAHFQAALALVMLIIILPWIRQWLFELALKGHMLLGLFVVVTAWLHLERRYEFDGICLIVAIGLYSLTSILHIIRQAIRNVVAGRSLAVANLKEPGCS